MNYYFVISALPPLVFGTKPEITFKEFKELLSLNLTSQDLKQVERLLYPIDLYNMRALWLGLPFDEKGNLSPKELEEALLVQERLSPYIADFLERYELTADRLKYFSSLYTSLYSTEGAEQKGFLRKYYQMEREIRLVLTALRAKQAGKDIARELQFEEPSDPLVADILVQKDSSDYMPPREYEDLKVLFVENSSDPQKLQYAIAEYQFKRIDEIQQNQDLTIDRVLAYAAQLILVENWAHLDRERGLAAVEQMSQE